MVSTALLTLHAQQAVEPPQALILAAGGARVVRMGSGLPLSAKPGEIC